MKLHQSLVFCSSSDSSCSYSHPIVFFPLMSHSGVIQHTPVVFVCRLLQQIVVLLLDAEGIGCSDLWYLVIPLHTHDNESEEVAVKFLNPLMHLWIAKSICLGFLLVLSKNLHNGD
jgi:hypothetical protein